MTMSLSELRNDLHDRSDLQAARLGISGAGVNDAADAFRHALSSAILARDYGPGIAENLGVIFEILAVIERGPQEEPASRMDVWNNSVGREIQHNLGPNATDEQLADAVAAALGNGRLVITPDASASASVVSKSIGTTPDPLVKTIHYVDPLILDLDGDGLEITPLAKGVLFDTDGDSIKTGTAWVGADDGLLVWDRNCNGQIDTGAELFGDETILANGQKAPHGFAALSELDKGSVVNGVTVGAGDGVFDAKDAQYASLRIWRDLNQDGVSQAGELKTLAESGVQSIKLTSSTTSTNYGDALLVQQGSFTRSNGSTGEAGSFILAQNNFVRSFTPITVSAAAQALPNLQGSGWVRDLQEAATVSPELIALVNQAKDAPTRAGYKDAVAALMREWGNDSAARAPQRGFSPVRRSGSMGRGLNLSAEIKIGRRRVIDYFLSPVQQRVSESLMER